MAIQTPHVVMLLLFSQSHLALAGSRIMHKPQVCYVAYFRLPHCPLQQCLCCERHPWCLSSLDFTCSLTCSLLLLTTRVSNKSCKTITLPVMKSFIMCTIVRCSWDTATMFLLYSWTVYSLARELHSLMQLSSLQRPKVPGFLSQPVFLS